MIPLVLVSLVVFGIVAAAHWLASNHDVGGSLASRAWVQGLLLLGPAELRSRGQLSLGIGVLQFALLLTLRFVLHDTGLARWLWPILALPLALGTVGAIGVAAVLYERAARLEGE